jgi:UDP-N-acetylglucosamine 1-carboxyvinyltransferase
LETVLAEKTQAAFKLDTPHFIRVRGGKPLSGEVVLRGAKNAVPKQMVAALLSEEPCVLKNIPHIEDIHIIADMIRVLGGEVEVTDEQVTITAKNLKLPKEKDILPFVNRSRIPVLACGPMLARLHEAIIPMPGGCKIGSRPINFHLNALQSLGATLEEQEQSYFVKTEGLHGTKITLDYPSVGATEQVILSSVLAEGVTELTNAAVEPEVIDLIAVLQKMGSIISVDTDRVITIVGVKKLHGYTHTAVPDRLEAASWACAAALTNGRIFVRNAKQLDMMTFLNKYRQVGGEFDVSEEGITFYRANGKLTSISLETDVHPGFMTDWQQPFVVVLTQAEGASIVHETVYEKRFGYVETLNDMGAKIQLYNKCLGGAECRYDGTNYLHSAVITGPTPLHGTDITVPDLRGGFSYVIAALAAEGESKIDNMETLARGYEDIVGKLKGLGAEILEVG